MLFPRSSFCNTQLERGNTFAEPTIFFLYVCAIMLRFNTAPKKICYMFSIPHENRWSITVMYWRHHAESLVRISRFVCWFKKLIFWLFGHFLLCTNIVAVIIFFIKRVQSMRFLWNSFELQPTHYWMRFVSINIVSDEKQNQNFVTG